VGDDSAIQNALAGLRARPRDIAPRRHPIVAPTGDGAAAGAFLALLVAVAVVAVLAVTVVSRNTSAAVCPRITYAFEGAPPSDVRAQFAAATDEIHRLSGLQFTQRDDGAPRLRVAWVTDVQVTQQSAAGTGEHATAVGAGFGRWHTEGLYRVLDGASIELKADWKWAPRQAGGDNLRSVLMHELGHVVGLRHSPDPASYMYAHTRPTPQHWTAEELEQLAKFGKQAGCEP
jgi:hypothetical protein